MQSVDFSQQASATEPVVLTQDGAPVTAGASAPDNATPPVNSQVDTSQVTVPAGQTGAGGDDDFQGTPPPAPVSYEDYQNRKAALLSGKTAEASPAQPAAQEPAPQTQPAPTPPREDDEDEFPSAPEPGQRLRPIKLRPVTPVDVRVMAEFKASQKAGNNQSFVEFVQSRFPGTAPAATNEPGVSSADTPQPTDGQPQTLAEVDAKLKELKDARYKHLEVFDFDAARELEEQEEALRARKDELKQGEEQRVTEAERQRIAEEEKYLSKAGQMFPQVTSAEHPLAVKAGEILDGWVADNDPRAGHPSALLYCYIEAAADLGVQPSAPAASSPQKQSSSSPSPGRPQAPITALIASGNATTTSSRSVEERLTPANYEAAKAKFLASQGRAA